MKMGRRLVNPHSQKRPTISVLKTEGFLLLHLFMKRNKMFGRKGVVLRAVQMDIRQYFGTLSCKFHFLKSKRQSHSRKFSDIKKDNINI